MKSRRRINKSTVFALLMTGSAVAALLPPGWTACSRGVVQPLALLQYGVSSGVQTARNAVDRLTQPSLTPQEARKLIAENEALERRRIHQDEAIAALQQQLEQVSGIRDQFRDTSTVVHVVRVIGYDASRGHETLTIDRGGRLGLEVGQWVVAVSTTPEGTGTVSGRERVMREWIIGRILEVHPYSSHVLLTTDRRFKGIRVTVAGPPGSGASPDAADDCLLSGVGRGRMLIDRATRDYFAAGRTFVVLRDSGRLPAPLAIGRIISSSRIPEAPLHFDLAVAPLGDVRKLRFVYVIAPAS